MPSQAFETTVVYNLTCGLHVYSIPKHAFRAGTAYDIDALIKDLPLAGTIDVANASDIARALAAIMSEDTILAPMTAVSPPPTQALLTLYANPNLNIYMHAEHAAFAKIVPFESSPLDLDSMAGIFSGAKAIAGAGAVAVGVKLGLLVAAGAVGTTLGPVLLMSAAGAGVLVVCSAKSAGDELGRAVGKKVAAWLGLNM